jgi:hypothetical protein
VGISCRESFSVILREIRSCWVKDKTEETLTAEQMFKRVYLGDRHVTFQTCIKAYGNQSWGRMFVIAVPKSQYLSLDWQHMQTPQ